MHLQMHAMCDDQVEVRCWLRLHCRPAVWLVSFSAFRLAGAGREGVGGAGGQGQCLVGRCAEGRQAGHPAALRPQPDEPA